MFELELACPFYTLPFFFWFVVIFTHVYKFTTKGHQINESKFQNNKDFQIDMIIPSDNVQLKSGFGLGRILKDKATKREPNCRIEICKSSAFVGSAGAAFSKDETYLVPSVLLLSVQRVISLSKIFAPTGSDHLSLSSILGQ